METLSEWVNIFHDKIPGIVWYCAKNPAIFTIQIFSPEWLKWCLFTILIIWGKGVFHNSNLKIKKINNKANFFKSYF